MRLSRNSSRLALMSVSRSSSSDAVGSTTGMLVLDLSKVFARRAFPFLELLGELGGVDNCMRTGRSLLSLSLARGRVVAEG